MQPKFVGELNGIGFYAQEPDAAGRGMSPCVGRPARYATEAEVKASGLDFTLGYLPAGFRKLEESATACGDVVVTVSRAYGGSGFVGVVRLLGRALVPASAPREYLQAGQIGGRAAVILPPIVPGHRMAVWMRDEVSVWTVSCVGLDQAECVKVAAGAK